MFQPKHFFLMLVLFSSPLLAQTTRPDGQQLSIGQIPYRLGMTMNEAMAITHEPISLDDRGETSPTAMWGVREKHGENNFVLIGTIIFRDGKAETIRRDLKSFDTRDTNDMGDTLFQALEQLKRDDPSVSAKTRNVFMSSESGQVKIITIGTGLRRIEIVVPDFGKAQLTIAEILTLAK